MLDERKMLVLQAIINDYIQTAEPVGSRTIARKYDLGVSPATIRNEMADLEDIGYLQQPHVSAGRIPSDKGYRFYVDSLMEPYPISENETRELLVRFRTNKQEIEKLIQETSKLLSMMTQSLSVVVAPPVENLELKYVQLVPIDSHSILVILVLSPGIVKNRIITVKKTYTPIQLNNISALLNEKLSGITYRQLGASLIREMIEEFDEIGTALIEIVADGLEENREDSIHLHGAIHIFNEPEFKDLNRAKSLLGVLEEKGVLLSIIKDSAQSSGVHAVIGTEIGRPEIQECSLVTATYHIGGEVIGAIGVIGPTRMRYSKMFSMVEFIADTLSEILTEFAK